MSEQTYSIGIKAGLAVTTELPPGDIGHDVRQFVDQALQQKYGKGCTGEVEDFVDFEGADPFERTQKMAEVEGARKALRSLANIVTLENVHDRCPEDADPRDWYAAVISAVGNVGNVGWVGSPEGFWEYAERVLVNIQAVKAGVVRG